MKPRIKWKNFKIWIKDQFRRKTWFKNFFITGNAWGGFSINSHINQHTNQPKIAFTHLESAQKAADRLRKYLQQEKPTMILWTGNNLKEVIDFTGKSPKFGEWFKSWEEYENYVHSHNDILKLFCEDGSHYEVPVGAWIVKTPDGYNMPSVAKYIQQEQPNEGKQVIIITETNGDANIHWDCRSLEDVMLLLESAKSYINDKQIEELRGHGSEPDYNTTEGRFRNAHKFQQEQLEVDLEKEIIRYQREDMDRDTTVRDVARHFYELSKARKEK